jgi:hypothetical protein
MAVIGTAERTDKSQHDNKRNKKYGSEGCGKKWSVPAFMHSYSSTPHFTRLPIGQINQTLYQTLFDVT